MSSFLQPTLGLSHVDWMCGHHMARGVTERECESWVIIEKPRLSAGSLLPAPSTVRAGAYAAVCCGRAIPSFPPPLCPQAGTSQPLSPRVDLSSSPEIAPFIILRSDLQWTGNVYFHSLDIRNSLPISTSLVPPISHPNTHTPLYLIPID